MTFKPITFCKLCQGACLLTQIISRRTLASLLLAVEWSLLSARCHPWPRTLGSQRLVTASFIRNPHPQDQVVKIRLPLKHHLLGNGAVATPGQEREKNIVELISDRLSEMTRQHKTNSGRQPRRRRVKLRFRRERPRTAASRLFKPR